MIDPNALVKRRQIAWDTMLQLNAAADSPYGIVAGFLNFAHITGTSEDLQRARKEALALSDPYWRAQSFLKICDYFGKKCDLVTTEELAGQIEDDYWRDETLADLAKAFDKKHLSEDFKRVADKTSNQFVTLATFESMAKTFEQTAQQHGRPFGADYKRISGQIRASFKEAKQKARNPVRRSRIFAAIARGAATIGDKTFAREIAVQITDGYWKAMAFYAIFRTTKKSEDFESLYQAAIAIKDPYWKGAILSMEVVMALCQIGDFPRVCYLIETQLVDQRRKMYAWEEVAKIGAGRKDLGTNVGYTGYIKDVALEAQVIDLAKRREFSGACDLALRISNLCIRFRALDNICFRAEIDNN